MARLSLQSTSTLRAQLLPIQARPYRHPSQPSKRSLAVQTGKLHGSRCLITGGSRGIGKAIALHFARLGASCYIVGRKESDLVEVVAELDRATTKASTAGNRNVSASRRGAKESAHGYFAGGVSRREFWEETSSRIAVSKRV